MKKVIISIISAAGVFGIIALTHFHPTADTNGVAATSPAGTSTANTSTSSSSTASATPTAATTTASAYKNGTYTGSASDNNYGTVQVKAVISGGKLTNVVLVQMPNDRQHSAELSSMAGPQLIQEALTAQSANIDVVSGATSTSDSFAQSLQSALNAAKA
jgi:uncharacterized protein with FMN-binding domain